MNTHVEATGTAIFIQGRAFRGFGASDLGCFVAFSVDLDVAARSRFGFLVLEAKVLLGTAAVSWRCLERCSVHGGD